MSEFSYRWARRLCYPAFWVSSRPLVLHRERARLESGFILAATHLRAIDTALVIRHSPRQVDFMSIVEMKSSRIILWFFGLYNTFYLDRSRPDTGTTLTAVHRLQQGRVVAMFPEGNVRPIERSVIAGGPIKPGIAGIAQLADVPVVPMVILGGDAYDRILNWAPIFGVRYGAIFGEPLKVRTDLEKQEARTQFLEQLRQAYRNLAEELAAALDRPLPTFSGDLPAPPSKNPPPATSSAGICR